MSFDFIANLSESSVFSSKAAIEKYTTEELAELAYLFIVTLRILLWNDDTKTWAKEYCHKTTRANDFKSWRTDSTDLYAAMYGLVVDKEDHSFSPRVIWTWLHKASQGYLSEQNSRELFFKLDSYFHIRHESMKAIRRLVMEFPDLKIIEKKLAITRLLQLLRHRAGKSELLKELTDLSKHHHFEIKDAHDPEEKKYNFISNLKDKQVSENATAGATSAASIAAVAGGLGAGFDNDYSKSIYGKKPKEKPPLILKR
jgi:hypothetical protein